MVCEAKPAEKHCFKVYAGLGPFTLHSFKSYKSLTTVLQNYRSDEGNGLGFIRAFLVLRTVYFSSRVC